MGLGDAVPVIHSDAEHCRPAGGARSAMHSEYIFGRHAQEPTIRRMEFLLLPNIFFREDGQLGEFFKVPYVGWVNGCVFIEFLIEARILVDVSDLALELTEDMTVPLGRGHGL
jgi:hypothetical protein